MFIIFFYHLNHIFKFVLVRISWGKNKIVKGEQAWSLKLSRDIPIKITLISTFNIDYQTGFRVRRVSGMIFLVKIDSCVHVNIWIIWFDVYTRVNYLILGWMKSYSIIINWVNFRQLYFCDGVIIVLTLSYALLCHRNSIWLKLVDWGFNFNLIHVLIVNHKVSFLISKKNSHYSYFAGILSNGHPFIWEMTIMIYYDFLAS